MNKIVYAFLIGTASANMQNLVECDTIGDGDDADDQYDEYIYYTAGDNDCHADNTIE